MQHFKSYDDLMAWIRENTNFRFKVQPNRDVPAKSTVPPLQAANA